MRYSLALILMLLLLFLMGCSTPVEAPILSEKQEPAATSRPLNETAWSTAVQKDAQGAVTVVVQPLNLDAPGETIDFDVTLDTHSVDLSMDLSRLAFLSTSDGREVAAVRWDAPSGGHHVSGTLFFPATVDGFPLLAGAAEITLVIKDLAASERRFEWSQVKPVP
jgi:hypothetical protein